MSFMKLITAGILVASVSACQSTTNSYQSVGYNSHRNEAVAAVSGAVLGGYAAHKASNGKNPWATAAGVLLGASVGTSVGRAMDRNDAIALSSDNYFVERAGEAAVMTGQPQQWRNDQTGSWGVVTPSPLYNWTHLGQNVECKNVYMKSVRNDLPHEGSGRACRGTSGDWFVLPMT